MILREKGREEPPQCGTKSDIEAERRDVARYALSASAEVSDAASGTRLATRVGDISITGCYLDSINPFPEGTRLRLNITRDGAVFHGEGTVRYAKFGMGMGLAFLHLDDGDRGVLQGWIEKLNSPATIESPTPVTHSENSGTNQSDAIVLRLIEKLQEKEFLTREDVISVLRAEIP